MGYDEIPQPVAMDTAPSAPPPPSSTPPAMHAPRRNFQQLNDATPEGMTTDIINTPRDQVPWHERQRVWRTVGLVVGSLGGVAAATGVQPLLLNLVSTALPNAPVALAAGISPLAAWAWTLGGAAAVALGSTMWSRRCYRDPEALQAYYADFCRRGFMAAAADHKFSDLLRIATPEGMATKLLEEMARLPGFDAVWRTYGEAHLADMLHFRVLTPDYLRSRLAEDHETRPFHKEEEAIDLLEAMLSYGRWVINHLEVAPAWIRYHVENDVRERGLSFSQFVALGGMALHPNAAAKLIGRERLRDMFWCELHHKEWTFKRVKELCCPWLFARDPLPHLDLTDDQEDEEGVYSERSLIRPEELAGLFHNELLALELSDLLDLYWKWPLSGYGQRLVPDVELLGTLRRFQSRYEKVVQTNTNERQTIKAHFDQQRTLAESIYNTKVGAANREYSQVVDKYGEAAKEPIVDKTSMMDVDAQEAKEDKKEKEKKKKKDEKTSAEEAKVAAERKKAQRKLAKARNNLTSAKEAAALERTLLLTMLESDRDDQLRKVEDQLRQAKAQLNKEWLHQHRAHLDRPNAPILVLPTFAPMAFVQASAPPLEDS